jgi:hypothetical protein
MDLPSGVELLERQIAGAQVDTAFAPPDIESAAGPALASFSV